MYDDYSADRDQRGVEAALHGASPKWLFNLDVAEYCRASVEYGVVRNPVWTHCLQVISDRHKPQWRKS
jgi:hypothetical protein